MTRTALFALACLAAAAPLGAAPLAEPLADYSGEQLYRRFCASCHGAGARGDGPVAPLLKVMVPDLTQLARRQGGQFSADKVREIVDGRAPVGAHGPRLMPVWGYEFEAQSSEGRAAAQELVDRLVAYLRSLQELGSG